MFPRSRMMLRIGLPGLFLGVALCWVVSNGRQVAAQATNPVRSGTNDGSTIAMTTGTLGAEQRLYLIDTKKQTFAIYKIDKEGWIELLSVRRYQADMELSEFNNKKPTVSEIQETVHSLQPTHTR
jgi:hypothetical protein